MRKTLFYLLLLFVCFRTMGQGVTNNSELFHKAITVTKFVELDSAQLSLLTALDTQYNIDMDSALNHTDDLLDVSKKIYYANRRFETGLYQMLTESQASIYIQLVTTYDVLSKTVFKIDLLRSMEKYSESELQAFTGEIYNYLMLEEIARVRDKYFILRQEDNLLRLKNSEPASLREANALQAANHRGIQYQNGYKW